MITQLIQFDETNHAHLLALEVFNLSGHPLCSIGDTVNDIDILLREHVIQTFSLPFVNDETWNGSTIELDQRNKHQVSYKIYFYFDSANNKTSDDDEFCYLVYGNLLVNEQNRIILQITNIIPS